MRRSGLQTRYVYGDDLDEPLIAVSSGGTLTFYHADRLGSIVATSDPSTGAVTNKNLYSPLGEIGTLAGTSFGFTGQRYDPELGLYYFKHRYYAPKLGRFLQADPIGYTGEDFNLYTYVDNSPLFYTDPLGLQNTSPGGRDITPDANRELRRQQDTEANNREQRAIDRANAERRARERVKTDRNEGGLVPKYQPDPTRRTQPRPKPVKTIIPDPNKVRNQKTRKKQKKVCPGK